MNDVKINNCSNFIKCLRKPNILLVLFNKEDQEGEYYVKVTLYFYRCYSYTIYNFLTYRFLDMLLILLLTLAFSKGFCSNVFVHNCSVIPGSVSTSTGCDFLLIILQDILRGSFKRH